MRDVIYGNCRRGQPFQSTWLPETGKYVSGRKFRLQLSQWRAGKGYFHRYIVKHKRRRPDFTCIAVVKPYPSVGFTVCCMHLNFFKRQERLPVLEGGSWGGKFTINKQHSALTRIYRVCCRCNFYYFFLKLFTFSLENLYYIFTVFLSGKFHKQISLDCQHSNHTISCVVRAIVKILQLKWRHHCGGLVTKIIH